MRKSCPEVPCTSEVRHQLAFFEGHGDWNNILPVGIDSHTEVQPNTCTLVLLGNYSQRICRSSTGWRCTISVCACTVLAIGRTRLGDQLPTAVGNQTLEEIATSFVGIIVVKFEDINLNFVKVQDIIKFEKVRDPNLITTVIGRRSVFLIL